LYKRYGHAFDAFKIALAEEQQTSTSTEQQEEDDPFASLDVPSDIIDELKLYIRRRLAPQPIKIRADVEVSCFTYDGIDAIREALFAGIAVGGTENSSIKIRLIAPPIYVLSTMTLEKEVGIALLQKAIDVILSKISEKGGKMDVKMAPKAVSLKEETELQAMMERLELENREVEGDEPEVRRR
jgi:translation initiation factor 2 subunit 1